MHSPLLNKSIYSHDAIKEACDLLQRPYGETINIKHEDSGWIIELPDTPTLEESEQQTMLNDVMNAALIYSLEKYLSKRS